MQAKFNFSIDLRYVQNIAATEKSQYNQRNTASYTGNNTKIE